MGAYELLESLLEQLAADFPQGEFRAAYGAEQSSRRVERLTVTGQVAKERFAPEGWSGKLELTVFLPRGTGPGEAEPLLAAVGGSPDIGLGFHIRAGQDATFVDIGSVITAAINFLIIAAVVYFILVAPMNKLNEMSAKRKGIDPAEAVELSETDLLMEIRDLLAAQNTAGTTAVDPNAPGGGTDGTGSSGRHAAD